MKNPVVKILALLFFLGALVAVRSAFAATSAPGDVNALDALARTGATPPATTGLWDAAAADPRLYGKLFARGQAPDPAEWRGKAFRGLITYMHQGAVGKLILNAVIAEKPGDFFLSKTYTRPLTFEDRFFAADDAQGRSGVNFLPSVGKENKPMRISLSKSFMDPKGPESLKIDYAVKGNDSLVRPTIDEVRRIAGTELYFGRSFYRVGKKRVPLLWFFMTPDRPYPAP